MLDRRRIEITGPANRFFAEQLIDKGRRALGVEAVEGGAEHGLGAPGNLARQPALRNFPQNVFILEAAHFPARVQPGEEVEDFLVEERIARLDRGVHGDAVTLGAHEQTWQMGTAAYINRSVKGVPAANPL